MSGKPAGFWRRYAAWSLDWLLLGPLLALALLPLCARAWAQGLELHRIVQDWLLARMGAAEDGLLSPTSLSSELLHDPAFQASAQAATAGLSGTLWLIVAIAFGVSALYFVLAEGGPWQATPGKRALRLRVHTLDGSRVGYARALARHLGGALSWALLNLGHVIVALRSDRRALHDLLAGTQVLAEAPMPGWARAWLGLQAAALVAVLFGLFAWLAWLLAQLASL